MNIQEITPDILSLKRSQLVEIECLLRDWENSIAILQDIEEKLIIDSPNLTDKIRTVMDSHISTMKKCGIFIGSTKVFYENIQMRIEEQYKLFNQLIHEKGGSIDV